jgi:YD repeat-containing protein
MRLIYRSSATRRAISFLKPAEMKCVRGLLPRQPALKRPVTLKALALMLLLWVALGPSASTAFESVTTQWQINPIQAVPKLASKSFQDLVYAYKSLASFTASRISRPQWAEVGNSSGSKFLPGASAPVMMVVLNAPTNLSATSSSSASINLSWSAPGGSLDHYQLERSQSLAGPFTVVANPTLASYTDSTVSSGNAYLYRVRAIDSFGAPSPPSTMAMATAITFEDPTLNAGSRQIKKQHFYDLRQSVNAVRAVAGLGAFAWTDPDLTGSQVRAYHVQQLRDKLDEALVALSIPVTPYDDPSLATGANGTWIRKIHIEQLRLRSTRGSSTSTGPVFDAGGLSQARLDPANRVGGSGEDPLSRNFNWGASLIGLPGRAGLDLGLSLSYNSLVWTKSGSYISFNDDGGFPAPGFRLGFPVIQPIYYNSEVGKNAFMLIGPDGSRTELRQVAASTKFEAADSSYLLLDSSTMILRTTGGTQLSYVWQGSDYQCTQIKDRNGNYITINYTAFGRIDTVVDTLARTIKFNYDANNALTSITQTWTVNGVAQTHTWATFTYTNLTIATNFTGLTNVGPQNGTIIQMLTRLTFNDSSRVDFDYTSWGQVWKVSNFAAYGNLLNYRTYKLMGSPLLPNDPAEPENDCPRFTERRDWAENWNRSGPVGQAFLPVGPEQEVITAYAIPTTTSWTLPDSTQQTGKVAQVTQPDGTYQKIYFAGTAGTASGWQRGLPSMVETYDSASVRQRQSVTTWTQDNASASYPLNPRVSESNVYDPSGNRARTRVTYQAVSLPDGASCQLPQDVYEYEANAITVLRRSHTNYNLATTYTNRRIIGLVSEKTLYAGDQGALMSKVSFQYDEEGSIQGADAPVQHDNTNYGAGFVAGRGNLSSSKRYDVTDSSQFAVSSLRYNTGGSLVASIDPLGHQSSLSYADSFSDGNNSRNTLAYPTTVTDADGYSSSSQYNFDFGAVTRKQTPQPNTTNNVPGPVQTLAYDSFGRLERITNLVNNAYTRFEYPSTQNRVDTYATIQEGLGEAHSFKFVDGHGRTFAGASDHPGSVGGFSGQLTLFDAMGRAVKTSNPTETSASGSPVQWVAAGDDAAAGWLYMQQTYDWKGRPRITTNTDGTTKEASYAGCGCAGGEVVTLTDEGTLVAGVTKKRQQKIYADVLGRTVKTEVLNWDGAGPFGTAGSVYSATVNSYNVRDQLTQVRQYAGAEGSATYQDTMTTYDGYGRLKTKHVPEQNAGTATIWDYNSDDTVQKVTDARGSVSNFSYNARHLITGMTYDPSTGISDTPDVSFGYDAAGNRTSMTDGLGSVSYVYDQLSRMTSESRTFTGVGSFNLSYGYNLAGQLTGVTDPFGAQVGYTHDTTGRVTTVSGANFGSVSTYASNIQYRAAGALKYLDYGNSRSLSMSYNTRLQPASFTVPGVSSKTYDYQADGRLKFSHEVVSPVFDRSYAHDHAGRITEALSGAEARNEGTTNNRPYKQSFVYDALGHLTERPVNKLWSEQGGVFSPAQQTYVNERNTAWTYDADGNLTDSGAVDYTFDAAGQTSRFVSLTNIPPDGQPVGVYAVSLDVMQTFDGDGRAARKVAVNTILNSDPEANETITKTSYLLRSSVLGGKVVSEIGSESEQRGFVYLGDTVLALQDRTTQTVKWEHRDADNASIRMTSNNGTVQSEEMAELDPLGSNAGLSAPVTPSPAQYWKMSGYPGLGSPGTSMTCIMDFIPTPCSEVSRAMGSGIGVQCENNNCSQVNYDLNNGKGGFEFFRAYNDGFSGYVPVDGTYQGNGNFMAPSVGAGSLDELADYAAPPLGRSPEYGGSFTEPQKPTQVPVPVGGTEGLEKLLRKLLVGHCKKAMEGIIDKIATSSGYAASSTDLMQLFKSLTAQTGGGGVFADIRSEAINDYVPRESAIIQQEPPGGGGLSWMVVQKSGPPQRVSAIFVLSYYSDYPHKLGSYPFRYFGRAVHELTHNAPKVGGRFYSHEEMDTAAKLLGSNGFDQYVKENCIPKRYW